MFYWCQINSRLVLNTIPVPVGKCLTQGLPYLRLLLSGEVVKTSLSQSAHTIHIMCVLLGSVAHFAKMERQAVYEAGHTAARQVAEALSN